MPFFPPLQISAPICLHALTLSLSPMQREEEEKRTFYMRFWLSLSFFSFVARAVWESEMPGWRRRKREKREKGENDPFLRS